MQPDPKRGRKIAIAAVVLVAAIAIAIVGLIDHAERQSIVELVAKNVPAAAGRLAQRYPLPPKSCPVSRPLDDYDLLAGALAAVESLNTSIIERTIEEALVRIAVFAKMPIPDFSIGHGQIRPSTANAALHDSQAGDPAPADGAPPPHEIALQLLSPCRSLDWGTLVVKNLAGQHARARWKLSREEIMDLAGKYNSQITAATNEAALANYLYRELTYQVFQEYRFRLVPID